MKEGIVLTLDIFLEDKDTPISFDYSFQSDVKLSFARLENFNIEVNNVVLWL